MKKKQKESVPQPSKLTDEERRGVYRMITFLGVVGAAFGYRFFW